MSNFGDHPTGFFGKSEFYNGVTTTSLMFDKPSGGYLHRTPGSTGNRRTFTFAFWYKPSRVFASEANDQNNAIFYADEPDGGGLFALNISAQGQGAATDTVNELTYYDFDSGDSTDYSLETNRAFADPSAWYHIVVAFDTTQGTEANRVKYYINGVQLDYTSMNAHHGAIIQNRETNVNQQTPHWIGRNIDTTSRYLEGYLADFNFIDGTQYAASNFGETKNGVWIPKEPDGVTYGTNGFRLQFKETGTGTASSSTVGADTSGNDNHFTSSGIAASDIVPDCPENNFCTLNSIGRRYGQSNVSTFSEGNLKATSGGNASHNFGTMAINQVCANGGVYFEIRNVSIDGNRNYGGVIGDNGVNNKNSAANGASYSFPIKGLIGLMADPRGYFNTATDASGSLDLTANANFVNGDVIGFAIKSDGKFFVHRNGTYLNNADGNTGNPSTGANPIATIDLTEGDWVPYCGYNSTLHANFGQDGSFAGTETSGGNSDANGFGDFMFAVPTGYLAICSANMVKPAIGPDSGSQADNYFDITLYTGNGGDKTISGFNFQPDWVWSKARSVAHNHHIHDSSRGVEQRLSINTTDQEASDGALKTFTSDGYTFDVAGAANTNNQTYVNWVWHANAGTTTTNDASSTGVGTIDSVIQANTKAGFSIVLYTGTGSAGTIAHGLGAVPKWYFARRRSNTGHMEVYHAENTSAPATEHLRLSANIATGDDAQYFNDTDPTSTVFSVGDHVNVNASGQTYVAYVFAEVEGYSKFGSYIGNGAADGPFVFTGFKPAWVMIKNTARGADWRINDTTRQTINKSADTSGGNLLLANSNSAEITNEYDIDFLSNGFKLRSSDVYENGDGEALIYMAFAEAPFKYSNAH